MVITWLTSLLGVVVTASYKSVMDIMFPVVIKNQIKNDQKSFR